MKMAYIDNDWPVKFHILQVRSGIVCHLFLNTTASHEHNKLYLTQLNSMLQDLAAL